MDAVECGSDIQRWVDTDDELAVGRIGDSLSFPIARSSALIRGQFDSREAHCMRDGLKLSLEQDAVISGCGRYRYILTRQIGAVKEPPPSSCSIRPRQTP